MSSRDSNSLAASRRSQSQTWRCTSGSDTRRRSGRGGKSPPRAPRAGSLRPPLPLLPDQEAVRQQDGHGVPVKARPQPALILIPAQQSLGLLVILLHPVPPVCVLHQPLQRHLRTKGAPGVPPLAIRGILPDQPTRPTPPRRRHPPAAQRDESPAHPPLAPLPPGHRMPRPRRLGRDQVIGPSCLPAASRERHGEVSADGDHVALSPPALEATRLRGRRDRSPLLRAVRPVRVA
jgi:hypothetical protein